MSKAATLVAKKSITKMPRRKYTLLYYIGIFLVLVLTACDENTVYYRFEHLSLKGWEKNDTLNFQTEPVKQTGEYLEEVGLRISSDYPFMGLQLVVEQEVLPTHEQHFDTLNCKLIDRQGNVMGQGISHYQYRFPLTTLSLAEGERLHIIVRHDMKREILPGISDVGIRLSRN